MGNRKPKGVKENADDKRMDSEAKENVQTTTTPDAPKGRFQSEQQVQASGAAAETTVNHGSFTATEAKPNGSVLKQEAIANVLTSDYAGKPSDAAATSTNGVTSARAFGLKTMTFSGTDGTILGNLSGTPTVGQDDRASSRFGKKLDATNKKINFLASEQTIIGFKQPTPLAAGTGVQGYNGTPKNVTPRIQKNAGAVPGEMLYQRSLDEIRRDATVFAAGQVVKVAGRDYQEYPTKMRVSEDDGSVSIKPFTLVRGNYMPTALKVTISKDADNHSWVSGFEIEETDLSVNCDDAIANMASSNEVIDINRAEFDRQKMDANAGDETKDTWSPLPRATLTPTAILTLLRDKELTIGSEMYLAYKFANKAMSYQLNKAAKDGQDPTTPRNEMLLGPAYTGHATTDYKGIDPFDSKYYRLGAPSFLIDLFDSKTKYKNKADVLTQPRSLKMHLQTADNNINVFRLKPEFAAAVNAVDCFSTIAHPYDGVSPLYVTDCVRAVYPYSWRNSFGFTRAKYSDDRKYTSTLFRYNYRNRMTMYDIKVTEPLLAGVAYFFDMHIDGIAKIVGLKDGKDGSFVMRIPIIHSTTTFSLWDFLLCASVPYIQYERINSFRDLLDYQDNFEYPFSELATIEQLNPKSALNYTMTEYTEPLQAKTMPDSVAIHWIMPELFTKKVFHIDGDNQITDAPWYFNEDQFEFDNKSKPTAKLQQWSGVMSYPCIRMGTQNDNFDIFYRMSERDLRLCLDRMITLPTLLDTTSTLPIIVHKYSLAEDGCVAIKSNSYNITKADILKTPRELGWFAYDVGGMPLSTADGLVGHNIFADLEMPATDSKWIARQWVNANMAAAVADSDDVSAATVCRAQNFTQKWVATYGVAGEAHELYNYPLSIGDTTASKAYTAYVYGYVDSKNGGAQAKTDIQCLLSYLLFYNRIQTCPWVLDPFACRTTEGTSLTFDSYDFAYLFNFAGFMASDYREDTYNRLNQRQNQGWLYFTDPFVTDSPIFKDSVRLSNI